MFGLTGRLCLVAATLAVVAGRSEPLRLGSISQDPSHQIRAWMSFADHLASRLRSEGIDQGKVVVAAGIPQMAALLRERKVDVFIDSAFPVVEMQRLAGARLLARRWKHSTAEYRSVIFVRSDSTLKSIKQLAGRRISLEEPYSTTGNLLPKMLIVRAGLHLRMHERPVDPMDPRDVNCVYSQADSNTMLWVLKGLTEAGATDNFTFEKHAERHAGRFRIIAASEPLPRQLVACRADLPARLTRALLQVLLHLRESAEGRAALAGFEKTEKFDLVPPEHLRSLDAIREFSRLSNPQP